MDTVLVLIILGYVSFVKTSLQVLTVRSALTDILARLLMLATAQVRVLL